MLRHAELPVACRRLAEQRRRLLPISGAVAVEQHPAEEATGLQPFEAVGKVLGEPQSGHKMLLRLVEAPPGV